MGAGVIMYLRIPTMVTAVNYATFNISTWRPRRQSCSADIEHTVTQWKQSLRLLKVCLGVTDRFLLHAVA